MPSTKELDLQTIRKQQRLLQFSLDALYDIHNELEDDESELEEIDFRQHYQSLQDSIALQKILLEWFRGLR